MRWSIFVCLLVCLARFCEGGAIRCPSGVTDCVQEETEENADTNESSSLSSSGPQTECLSGTEWESNCHYCRCSDSGVAECLKGDTCDFGFYEEPYLCKPNTTFLRECNTCVCLENGLVLCSLQHCLAGAPAVFSPLKSLKENGKEEFKPSKNTNILTHSDRHLNDNLIPIHDVLKRSAICKPHQEFYRDCNPCKCAADGLSYSCTHNECLEGDMYKEVEVFKQSEGMDHIERHSVCRARNTFYISCNACHCNPTGTDYSCTNKPCPLPADVELFHELKPTSPLTNQTKAVVCQANRMFLKDCNTCWCNEDGTSYYCTRKVCVPLLPDEDPDLGGIPAEELAVTKKECRPDEVFEMDCNMCRCNPDGKSYSCTRRACMEPFERKNLTLTRKTRALSSEAPKACQPGQEFRMDCNTCLCDNQGKDFSCTRNDCNALNNNQASTLRRKRQVAKQEVSSKCEPGSVFNKDCNVCRCTDDGFHAICTLQPCHKQNELEAETRTPDSDLGFRCNPGEQFKRECNDCTCSADGRSIFCTLRLCDLDINSSI